jgi:predicted O-methyltransferase YrrM
VLEAAVDRAVAAAEAVQGLMTNTELRILARGVVQTGAKRIIEIGSYHGRSTTAMLAAGNARIVCVDDFSGTWTDGAGVQPDAGDVSAAFHRNMQPFRDRVIVVDKPSHNIRCVRNALREALGIMGGHADLTFIDGAHDYLHVAADIFTARAFTKPGGIICGHDIDQFEVRAAVIDHFGSDWLGDYTNPDAKMWWVHVKEHHGIR